MRDANFLISFAKFENLWRLRYLITKILIKFIYVKKLNFHPNICLTYYGNLSRFLFDSFDTVFENFSF